MRTHAISTRVLAVALATSLALQPQVGSSAPHDPNETEPPRPGGGSVTVPWPDFDPPQTLVEPADPIVAAPGPTAYLAGSGGVTPSGDYEYSIPIQVPAGRAGMQPNLALHYSSRRRDHVAGVGWSISGLSVIHRCAKRFFVDGAADGVDLDATDALCLDGKKLVKIGSNEYRTEREEFLRIVGNTAEHFTVYRKDGTIAVYESDGTSWPIASVHDRVGNEIRYRYADEAPHAIERIEYTTKTGDATPGPYRVLFSYQGRSPAIRAHVAGQDASQPHALSGIAIEGPNGAAWTYELDYQRSPVTKRLLLESVRMCTYGTCTQKRIFEYEQAAPEWQLKGEIEGPEGVDGSRVQVADFNGDGRDDILFARGHMYIRITQFLGSTGDTPPEMTFSDAFAFYDEYPVPVDIDRDGASEVVAFDESSKRWRLYRWNSSAGDFGEDASFPVVEVSSPPLGAGFFDARKVRRRERPYFVDLDGDGLPEMVKHVFIGQGAGPYDRVTRVWPNANGVFGAPQDHQNDFFPEVDSLLTDPPLALENYPAELDIRVEDRFGEQRQALVQRVYYGSERILQRDDNGALEVKPLLDPPSTKPRADIDLDGDGLRERLYFSGESETPADNVLADIEINAGSEPYEAGEAVAIDGGYPAAEQIDWLVGDLDEDGKEDLVMAPRSTTIATPFVKLAFATEDLVTVEAKPRQRMRTQNVSLTAFPNYRTRAIRLGDFDADGRADFLVVMAACEELAEPQEACDYEEFFTQFQVYTREGATPDQLVRVRDDGAARVREELTWMQWGKPQSGGMTDTCAYPAQCINRGFPVVREHRFMNPSLAPAAMDRAVYLFDAPRGHIAGRGFLGFGIMRVWYPQRPMEVTMRFLTQYPENNVYPYASAAGLETTVIPILDVPPSGRTDGPSEARARVVQRASYYDWVYTAGAANWTRFRSATVKEWEEQVNIKWGDWYEDHITGLGPVPEVPSRTRTVVVDWDAVGNRTLTTRTTVNGVTSQQENVYAYPSADWPVTPLKTRRVRSARSVLDPWRTRTTNFHHDANYNVSYVVREPGGNTQLEQTTKLERDPATGLITYARAYASGELFRWTFYQYDPTGAHVVYVGNSLGEATWRKVWPELGVSTVEMDANGASVQYVHDGLGRAQEIIPEGGIAVTYDHSLYNQPAGLDGFLQQSTSTDDAMAYNVADEAGRPREACATAFFTGEYACAYTEYDALGHARRVTQPGDEDIGGPATERTFDSLDRKLSEKTGDLAAATFEHEFFSTHASEPNGHTHDVVRDFDDRIGFVTDHGDKSVTTSYTYAEFDNVETVDVGGGQYVTVSTYDVRGRLTGQVDDDTGATGFAHNAFGELTTEVRADFGGRSWVRDAAGRVVATEDYDGATLTGTTITEWDKAPHGIGRVSKTINADGTIVTTHAYDDLGRPASTTWTIDGSESFTTAMDRDDKGRVNMVEYPHVAGLPTLRVESDFDGYGHVEAISARFVAPPAQDTVQELWRVNERALDGSLLVGTFGNGVATTRAYDGAGRLSTLAWSGPSVTMDLEYGYDASGNVTSRTDHSMDRVEEFDYDGLTRLRQWRLHFVDSHTKDVVTEYTYDDLGNLGQVIVDGNLQDDNTYGAQNKPHALDTDGFGATFQYDARGRMIAEPDRSVTYTQFDLPATVTTPSATWQFRYDAGQDRVIKTDGAKTTLRIADLYERRTSGVATTHTFRVPGTDGAAAEIVYEPGATTPTIRYLGGDRNGSVSVVTDAGGAEIDRTYFDPFGKRIDAYAGPPAQDPLSPLGFGGHAHDDELGLVDMTGRIYDPRRRRFITPDDIVPQPLSGQSYNRYSFGFQNPVTLVDPDGHDPDAVGWGFVPFGFLLQVAFSDGVGGTLQGSGSGGSGPGGVSNGRSTPKAPPPPVEVRMALDYNAFTFEGNEDPAPGCQHSKGGTSDRDCVGPGDQGCVSETEDPLEIGEYGSKAYAEAYRRDEERAHEQRETIHERFVRRMVKVMSRCDEDFCPGPGEAEAAGFFLSMLPMMVGEAPPGSLTTGFGITRRGSNPNVSFREGAHANSYQSLETQYLYAITDGRGEVLKYGTTATPATRYAGGVEATFGPGAMMEIITSGNVKFIRDSETRLIKAYEWINGRKPRFNRAYH